VQRFLAVLGFEETRVTFHFQVYEGHPTPLYTIVGRRTAGSVTTAASPSP
jgi:hypothetical protein